MKCSEMKRMDGILIRKMRDDEIPAALDFAWKVFSEYESPVYSAEGTEEFRRSIHDENYLRGIEYYGAYDGEKMVGEIGIRPERGHICFFFVDGGYHRRGIGTDLFKYLLEVLPNRAVTLNSAPYGLLFYRKLGFRETDKEQIVNGIRFTPMKYERNMMNELIGFCGLDCEKCEARIATVNNDDTLREKVAKKWSELNQVPITKEMINCVGCRVDGIKTLFCDSLCEIRQCALRKGTELCGLCPEMDGCEKLKAITDNSDEALQNTLKIRGEKN
ncbi:MAG: GNAT family N-acetyltransferase [Lachnospiraceae bacterium]|nr:GNAT family N-acetyltransferase [Lachnospiraceae bacterium]